MIYERLPDRDDVLAKKLHQAFPEEPPPDGLPARIVAAAQHSVPQRRKSLDEKRRTQRWHAVVTGTSATIFGLLLGITLGYDAFDGNGQSTTGREEPPAVYLALLSGYTDFEGVDP